MGKLTISRRDMRPIHRAIKQLHDIGRHALRLHLHAPEQLVPRVERALLDGREVERRDLGLGVRAGLIGGDEGDADAD